MYNKCITNVWQALLLSRRTKAPEIEYGYKVSVLFNSMHFIHNLAFFTCIIWGGTKWDHTHVLSAFRMHDWINLARLSYHPLWKLAQIYLHKLWTNRSMLWLIRNSASKRKCSWSIHECNSTMSLHIILNLHYPVCSQWNLSLPTEKIRKP